MPRTLRARIPSVRVKRNELAEPLLRRQRAAGATRGTAETAIASGTALALTGVSVACHWTPEQLALVLTAAASCITPALLRNRI
ncbi:hypothetical protein [Kitasatospora purpeofusca]|uniref:hypothetical protein n=1 Tax=Kitasatospora purpeofusca TaxID=67352 RepID=UPI0036D3D2D8